MIKLENDRQMAATISALALETNQVFQFSIAVSSLFSRASNYLREWRENEPKANSEMMKEVVYSQYRITIKVQLTWPVPLSSQFPVSVIS
jgi:hypothetical protein